MKDPFPFSAPPALQRLTEPVANFLDLTSLPLHIHEIIFATLFYTFVFVYVSPRFSSFFFAKTYKSLDRRTRLNWDVHVVSFVQSTVISILSLWLVFYDDDRNSMNWLERIHGYNGASGLAAAFGVGYFFWDLIVTGWNIKIFGIGMLAHAVSALTVFSLGFRPFLYFYSTTFLLYELSSPFLNIHWFMDKLDMTGSTPQLINGLALLFMFFGARLCFGTYSSIRVFYDMYRAYKFGIVTPALLVPDAQMDPQIEELARSGTGRLGELLIYSVGKDVPAWLAVSYLISNLILNSLNWFWFNKMIATIRKRFNPPFGTREPGKDANSGMDMDAQMGRSVMADGTKGVEVEGYSVRKRPPIRRDATDGLSPVHG